MKIVVFGPSNIAWIKYMGKRETQIPGQYEPLNPSLSMTLSRLGTYIEITDTPVKSNKEDFLELESGDFLSLVPSEQMKIVHAGDEQHFVSNLREWAPDYLMQPCVLHEVKNSDSFAKKFSDHLIFLKKLWNLQEHVFYIRSVNNFPAGSGIASSASSAAALAFAVSQMSSLKHDLSELSFAAGRGSGSASRSIGGPWVVWEKDQSVRIPSVGFGAFDIIHAVFVLSHTAKAVSSSEAHFRVLGSSNFSERPDRATRRLGELENALKRKDWEEICEIGREDSEDMHNLFETSSPSFTYQTKESQSLLKSLEAFSKTSFPMLITQDAGPNIQLSVLRKNLLDQFQSLTEIAARHEAEIFWDLPGSGVRLLSRSEVR